jgi:hypothetical protein
VTRVVEPDAPLEAKPLVWWKRTGVLLASSHGIAVILISLAQEDLRLVTTLLTFPSIFLLQVESVRLHMDGQGFRGRQRWADMEMAWSSVVQVELADAKWWRTHTRVVNRYGSVLEVPRGLRAAGRCEHPAALVMQEARARGIEVIGTQPVRSWWGAWRWIVLILIATLVSLALVPQLDRSS